MSDHYRVLDVSRSATASEIRQAYHRIVRDSPRPREEKNLVVKRHS